MPRRNGLLPSVVALLCAGVLAPPALASMAGDEMTACAALGPKRPGSAAETAMGDHIAAEFAADGLETTKESFHLPVWKPEGTSLTISAGPGAGMTMDAQSFAYSAPGHATAPVVDVGLGQPGDFDGKDLRGKIVLVTNGGTYHRTVQLEQIQNRGGIGMVYVSASPHNLIQQGAVRWGQRPPASIPAVSIGEDTGAALRTQLAQGTVTLDMDVKGERVDAVSRDIMGIRRGTTYPDKYVVIAGHYDSWYAGANDNCSADGTLLSVAHDNASLAPAYTTIYLGWGSEEPGLVGSYTWLWRHQDLVPDIAANINLEETATASFDDAGNPTSEPSETISFGSMSPALIALTSAASSANAVLPNADVPIRAERAASGGIIATDIEGFYAQGVQAVSTASSSPYYHTTGDTADKVNLSDLDRATSYIRDLSRSIQDAAPATLFQREVPKIVVNAPAKADAGAAVPLDIVETDADGQPVSADHVTVLVDQNDNWATMLEREATPEGNGHYAFTIPAGVTDADLTRVRATVSTTDYLADGFATIDQTAGGLAASASACRSKRTLRLHVARTRHGRIVKRLKATATLGTVHVATGRRRYTVTVDLRGAAAGAVRVRLSARTGGRTVRQTRTFRTCTPSAAPS